MIKNFIIESIDRCGKDTLINNLLHKFGHRFVFHRKKPELLQCYADQAKINGIDPLLLYQRECFANDMALLKNSEYNTFGIFFNRSWLGESVYANLYRGYSGQYVFELEKIAGLETLKATRLILLTEDFSKSKHFIDDGLSLGSVEAREKEQNLFINAFNKSTILDKKMICVTDPATGQFKSQEEILREATE